MKGIIVNDFETIIKRNELNMNEVKKDINKINNCLASLNRNFYSDDLKTLFYKLESEINQLYNVRIKIEAYHTVMQKVVLSYKQQAQDLARSINHLSPDNDII